MAGYLPSEFYGNVIHTMTHDDAPGREFSTGYTVAIEKAGTPNSWAQELHDTFAEAFRVFADTGVKFPRTTFYWGPSPSEIVGEGEGEQAGQVNTASPPANFAVLIHKRTGFAGRWNRGRMYIPWWVGEAAVNEVGQLTTAARNARQAVVGPWLTELADIDLPMVVAHSEQGSTRPLRKVTELTVELLGATQRRRMRRGS